MITLAIILALASLATLLYATETMFPGSISGHIPRFF